MVRPMNRQTEKFLMAILVFGGAGLLTLGYFSSIGAIKVIGGLVLIFVWYIAYDIVVNRD